MRNKGIFLLATKEEISHFSVDVFSLFLFLFLYFFSLFFLFLPTSLQHLHFGTLTSFVSSHYIFDAKHRRRGACSAFYHETLTNNSCLRIFLSFFFVYFSWMNIFKSEQCKRFKKKQEIASRRNQIRSRRKALEKLMIRQNH